MGWILFVVVCTTFVAEAVLNKIEQKEAKEEIENLKSCIEQRDNLLENALEHNVKLAADKERAVKACQKYRKNLNLLYNNLKNLNDTYSSNEVNLCKAIEQNIYLSGQLKAYKDAYGEIKQSGN